MNFSAYELIHLFSGLVLGCEAMIALEDDMVLGERVEESNMKHLQISRKNEENHVKKSNNYLLESDD